MKKADIQRLRIDRYDYPLPEERIAKYPLPDRDRSKLLIYNVGRITSVPFRSLPEQLPPDSLLLFNDTRVIHARLIFHKATGARVEVFCLSPYDPPDYAVSFQQRHRCSWRCMVGNARRWKEEVLTLQVPIGERVIGLRAERAGMDGGDAIVSFSWDSGEGGGEDLGFTFSELLEAAGKLPIPPYLNRAAESSDDVTYQTVYAQVEGSVAAPTAGLHFTPELMNRLRDRGIQTAEITLHVGAGTFKPVKSPLVGAHDLHTEFISVSRETIERLLHRIGSLIAVGTTSARTVESLYYIGKKLREREKGHEYGTLCETGSELTVGQWEPYEESDPIPPNEALEAILRHLDRTGETSVTAVTQLMIAHGYPFHYPDGLITNFHQPRSTLLLLVAAFIGEGWRDVYRFALENDFRFLSYGDGSLLWKNPK
ncbi:MAG: S-adenosylmethionine:tRNA ribosyltransferase-isomerase [Fermentimonas sp.]